MVTTTAAPAGRPAVPPLPASVGAILAVATASLFIREAQDEAMPSLAIAALRLGLASAVLVPLALLRRRDEIRRLGLRSLALVVLSGALLAFHFASWIRSLEHTSVASSVVLVATTPLWVALIAPFALGERLRPVQWVGLALAFGGMAWIALAGEGPPAAIPAPDALRGNLLALVGALFAAGYFMIGRRVRGGLSLLSYVALVYGVAALVLLVLLAVTGTPLSGYAPRAYRACVYLAVLPQLVGHSTFNWALRYLRASTVSLLILGEPVGSIVLASIFLGEAPTTAEFAASVLVLLGIGVVTWRPRA